MSGDVVDFAPVPRTRKWTRPNWHTSSAAVPLAVLGAALGAASLFGEWISITMPSGVSPSLMISSVGALGTAFVVALIALVTAVALALFGDFPGGTRNVRVAGTALCGSSLVLLGAIASLLTGDNEGPVFFDTGVLQAPSQTLGWGVYAAFGGVIALGVALLLPATPARRAREMPVDDDDTEFEDDAVDLTVTVEPVRGPGR